MEYFPLSQHGEGSSKENEVHFCSRTGPCRLIQQKRVGQPPRHELCGEFQVVYLESGLKKKGIGQYFPPAGQLSHGSKNAFIIDSLLAALAEELGGSSQPLISTSEVMF